MYSLKINNRIWVLDDETGKISPSEEAKGKEINATLSDTIKNKNIEFLLDHGCSHGVYVDKEGRLQRGNRIQKAEAVRKAVFEALKTLSDQNKPEIDHFFYHFLRNAKIAYGNRRGLFTHDPTSKYLDVVIGNIFWSVNQKTGLILRPRPIEERSSKTACYDLTQESSELTKHNLKMLFLRKKGGHFYVDREGRLCKGCGDARRVKEVINQTLAHVLHRVDLLEKKSPDKPPIRAYRELANEAEELLNRVSNYKEQKTFEEALAQLRSADEKSLYNPAFNLSVCLEDLGDELEEKHQALAQSAQTLSLELSRFCLSLSQDKLEETVEQVDEVQRSALSHFLYQFMNREGSIGRLSSKVGYSGPYKERFFNRDLMQKHVDIVIGDYYWSVNTQTGHVSKALPISERHLEVEQVDLSGEDLVNKNLRLLFERKAKAYFLAKEGCLEKVSSLRGRIFYWRHKKEEREKVRAVVKTAIQHLDAIVASKNDEALKIFLRKKFQFDGPLATMKVEHFDRSAISESGGIERFLKHDLESARALLKKKLYLLNQHPPEKWTFQEIPKERRLDIEQQVLLWMKGAELGQLTERINESLKKSEEMVQAYIPRMTNLLIRRLMQKAALENTTPSQLEIDSDIEWVVKYTKSQHIIHEVKDALHEYLIQEFLFAHSLGIDLKAVSDGGSGGARYAFNRFGKKILVVKPDDEGPYGRNNPRWTAYIKQFFLKIRSCLAENSEPISEVSSYNVDKFFNFNIVPSTSVRSIYSRKFVGKHRKWCSVQAFINGCQPMQDALELNESAIKAIRKRPWKQVWRDLGQIWKKFSDKYVWKIHQNLLKRDSVAKSFEEGGRFAENLKRVIASKEADFLRAFARFVIHNYLIGDTDCHFDNWFIKQKNVDNKDIQKLVGGQTVDIDNLVDKCLLENGLFYQLHDALFHDENGFIIVKHDGGSSMPRRHPASNFEVRLAYLFRVLPQMKELFAEEIKSQFRGGDRTVYETIATVAIHNLVNISTKEDFHAFWNISDNRKTFKKWLFTEGPDDEETCRLGIASALASQHQGRQQAWWHWHYDGHLKRIRGIAKTFKDRWVALISHLQEASTENPSVLAEEGMAVRDKSMKTLFEVKQKNDFKRFRIGHNTNRAFRDRTDIWEDSLVKWVRDPVPEIKREEEYSSLQQIPEALMRDLG